MPQLKIVYWHDIPSQVIFKVNRRNTRLRLSLRFMRAIERAAYRLKKKNKDALFEPWHDVNQIVEGDVKQQAQQLVKQLETEYPDTVLDELIRTGGKADHCRTSN